MAKILKRKKLFEEDFNQTGQTTQQPAQQQQQPAQQQQQPAQQPAQQQQQQPAQQQQQQVQPQQQQQQPQQQQQNQQQQNNDIQQRVAEILKKMENAYWAISTNVPEEIQKSVPEFNKDNEQAKPIIDLWEKFKGDPNQTTYNAFVDAFKNFGVPQQTDQNQQQQQAINAGYIADFDFRQALQENLSRYSKEQMIIDSLNYYYDPE